MGLVTDMPGWKPLLRAAEAEGIVEHSVVILQKHDWDADARRYRLLPDIDVEITDQRTWSMDAQQRSALESVLRRTVAPEWNTPALRFLWKKPPALEFITAMIDVRDKLWRDAQRRRVSRDAWGDAQDELSRVHKAVIEGAADHRPYMIEIDEILAEARRHPEPPIDIPPLNPDEIGVDEVMSILRRIVRGEAVPNVIRPSTGWKDLYHAVGKFECDEWTFEAWKRNYGVGYIVSVVSPDGRRAGYDDFERREGNPFSLLEDDEQDAIERVLEGE